MARSSFLTGSTCTALAAVASLSAATAAFDAGAVNATRYDYQGGAAVCQPTQPQHGAALRTQPLTGINNVGTGTIFVTCAFRGDDSGSGRGATRLIANVANYGSLGVAVVNCTLTNGRLSGPDLVATYTGRSAVVGAGAGATMNWVPAAIEGAPATITQPSIMCGLPSGTALQFIAITYDENVGA